MSKNIQVKKNINLMIYNIMNTNQLHNELKKMNDTLNKNYTYLNENLKDSSNIDANGDYSLSQTDFKFTSTLDNVKITRLLVFIQDSGNFSADAYGNNLTLTNGIKLYLKPSGGSKSYINGDLPVKTNSNWSALCYDITLNDFGVGDNSMAVRWTFSKATDLILDIGDEFGVDLNDSFTGLVHHYFVIQGKY